MSGLAAGALTVGALAAVQPIVSAMPSGSALRVHAVHACATNVRPGTPVCQALVMAGVVGLVTPSATLPGCTKANGCLTVMDEHGGTNYPPNDSGWDVEQALDVDAVSAACPDCKILVVQGLLTIGDLETAENTAAAQPGVVAISNSYTDIYYGGFEQVGGTSEASPLIAAVFALSGNTANYPAKNLYKKENAAFLYDVNSGSNGSCGVPLCSARVGWDGPTGMGTPHGVGAF